MLGVLPVPKSGRLPEMVPFPWYVAFFPLFPRLEKLCYHFDPTAADAAEEAVQKNKGD